MKTADYTDRICITAYGAVTPLGNTIRDIFENLRDAKSGITDIKKFDHRSLKTSHAGIPVEGNDLIHWPRKNRFRSGDITYAQIAAHRLQEQLNINEIYRPEEIGCIVGVEEPAPDVDHILDLNKNKPIEADRCSQIDEAVNYLRVVDCLDTDTISIINSVHDIISFSGTTYGHLGLCCASTQSIGLAMRSIARGEIKAAICGGIGAKVTPVTLARMEGIGVISTDEQFMFKNRSRPFDRRRSGFMLSEGAVLFTLEKESSIRARKAKPLAFLTGYGGALCAQNILTPHTDDLEMILSMQRALDDAGLEPADINMISAHATSTVQNDFHEARAISRVFNKPSPPVTATKSNHGHLMAAAGAMEILTILASFQNNFIPAIINLDEPDPLFPEGVSFVRSTTYKAIRYVLKNSFGMGGGAASLILENPDF